jgi:hypothetical protein
VIAMMTLQQVFYFLSLCDEQSFTRAAKRCGIKQPSLTLAIKQLEKELGGQLFVRSRRMSRLSGLGMAVQPHLAAMERAATAAKHEAAAFLATGGPLPPVHPSHILQAKGESHAQSCSEYGHCGHGASYRRNSHSYAATSYRFVVMEKWRNDRHLQAGVDDRPQGVAETKAQLHGLKTLGVRVGPHAHLRQMLWRTEADLVQTGCHASFGR